MIRRVTVVALLLLLMVPAVLAVPGSASGSVPATEADICAGPLAQYVLAPASRVVAPVAVASPEANGGIIQRPRGLLAPGGDVTHIEQRVGSDPILVVDFGKDVSGQLTIATTRSTSPTLRVAFSESLAFLGKDSDISWQSDHSYTWRPGPNADRFETGLATFRYVRLSLDDAGAVDIDSLRLDFTPYLGTPDTFAGCFASSDDVLNRIWYAGAYTLDLDTTVGNDSRILDGAKRDRAVWAADLGVQARVAYLTHGERAAVRASLADLADHQRADGSIPPTSYKDYTPILYDYCAWWVQTFVDYERYTGERAFAAQYYENLRRQMAWFLTKTDANGLLVHDQGIEWMWTTPRPGEVTELNEVYYQALLDAGDLATDLGHPEDASTWRSLAARLREAINARLFDTSRGVYISHAGDNHVPQDANALAVLYGLAPDGSATGILQFLKVHLWTPYGATTVNVPYGTNAYHDKRIWPFMGYFELEARFAAGDDRNALDLMRREWGHMIRADPASTLWEWMTADGRIETGYASLAHGWSAGATSALSEDVLGVRPSAPGYAEIAIRPHLGDLSWALGRVPTPNGPVDVSWRQSPAGLSGALTIPPGSHARVTVPAREARDRLTVDGQIVWDGSQARGLNASRDGTSLAVTLGPGRHTISESRL